MTGVRDFGAFIRIGAGKDGLLHVSDAQADDVQGHVADARDVLAVGQRVRVFVKAIDSEAGKFTLTTRPPVARPEAPREVKPSAAASAAMAAAKAREQQAREARQAEQARQEAARIHRAEIAAIEAAMVEAAHAREAAAAAAREEAGLLLPAAAVLLGQPIPPVQPTRRAFEEVLVRKMVNGKELVLYKMPWRYA